MNKNYFEEWEQVQIDGGWTSLPKDVIIRLIYEEYELTFEEWQKQGLPFPEKRKEEYIAEKNKSMKRR